MAELAGELASVMAVSVITQEVDCAHSGERVCAAEQPFVIALAKSANNQGVECAGDGEFVVQEPESALVGPEDAMQAEAMPADECAVVGFPHHTKLKSESSARKRLAGADLGAAAKKLHRGTDQDCLQYKP